MHKKQESESNNPVENIEQEQKGKDLTDGIDTMELLITNESRGITVRILTKDPTDAVFLAGFVITAFRKLGIEGTSKVMP